ncbi:hypothetical protein SAMN05216553_10764 [Lentzea fradiae]|uniref:Alpha/beta hydrolase n=2 Tax=Lentzea fradiae TaxID=200378 RepID=A0A1G7T799_9PSEU|nr:hypothetical protein SAMN05216553_10764 [Lentzea fradiae]
MLVEVLPAAAQPVTELPPCITDDLREDAIKFKAEDGVELPGVVLGSGSTGVLLASSSSNSSCDWLPLAQELADDGYQVLFYENRDFRLRDVRNAFDQDVLGAAKELERRGASSIVAGGIAVSAAAVATVAGRIPGLKGMFLLSPYRAFYTRTSELDAVRGIGAVQVPSLILVPEEKQPQDAPEQVDAEEDLEAPNLAEQAREVADAATNATLESMPGELFFTTLDKHPDVRNRVRAFVRETLPAPSFLDRWLGPIAGAVVLLAMVVAVVVVVRRSRPRRAETVALD